MLRRIHLGSSCSIADSSAPCPRLHCLQKRQDRRSPCLPLASTSSSVEASVTPPSPATHAGAQSAAPTSTKSTAPDVVTVYFRQEARSTTAKPGEDFLEVASRCSADIPTGCLHGSCGVCEVELFKYDTEGREAGSPVVLRACVARVPRGWGRVEVGMLGEDQVWGQDGWDT